MGLPPRITCYGGVRSIGGTKVAVEEGSHRVLIDFGLPYSPGGDHWGGPVKPRPGEAGLRDLITLGYLPALSGLYRPGQAEAMGLAPSGGDHQTHLFISHLHLDHMALVDHLAPDLPIWMHRGSLRLFRATAAVGEPPGLPAGARPFAWEQSIAVGPIRVTPVAVDHDIPGASAFLIETSAGTVVYSGDLRLHGAETEASERFMALAAATKPKVLLIEGTRLGEPETGRSPTLPEGEVAGRVADLLQSCPGLGLITLYPRNPGRVARIAAAVGPVGRRLVLTPELAYIYGAMGSDLGQVLLYRRWRDVEALGSGATPGWLTSLLDAGYDWVDAARLRAEPAGYLLQLFPQDLNELVDLQPPAGSLFIHANGEPLGRFDPTFGILTRWLDHFAIPIRFASSTGHASAADLHRIAGAIRPEILMPVHSMAPELLALPGVRRILPQLGATYAIATGERLA